MELLSTLALNLDSHLLEAALPLLGAGQVQAIEWSFDALWRTREIPAWFPELLGEFSSSNRLVGHGIFFSLLSGRWSEGHQGWLEDLGKKCRQFDFEHISEHFGFLTGADFRKGAPLGVPLTAGSLAIGQERLQRLADASGCPVGLENLAFAFSFDEAKRQGEFLERLVEPVDGFIVLDLHNLYCQMHNFELDPTEVLDLYPLQLAREIHISGGSWSSCPSAPGGRVRRDTHDGGVPKAVFQLLEQALARCPQVKYVVLEQVGAGLRTSASQERFREDFMQMDSLVGRAEHHEESSMEPQHLPAGAPNKGMQTTTQPHPPELQVVPDNRSSRIKSPNPLEDQGLHEQQMALSEILVKANNPSEAQSQLTQSPLKNTKWASETWPTHMLETAMDIAQKWKAGYPAPTKDN